MVKSFIKRVLAKSNNHSEICTIMRVHGGSINESFYVETIKKRYFLKYHLNAPNHFFEVEVKGLENIKQTRTISVPNVIAYSDDETESFLLLEWVEGEETKHTEKILGEKLAALHQKKGEAHGLSYDSYIGMLKQPNKLFDDWLTYYRDYRLLPQLEMGKSKNVIKGTRQERMETLLSQLEKWIPKHVEPSYLHGDLWGGNWVTGRDGEPYIVDPSFLYGDRHLDLALTKLFGGFSHQFYDAYEAAFPVDHSYEELIPLYQLYYLLVHLNQYGEAYGGRVDEVLMYYVG